MIFLSLLFGWGSFIRSECGVYPQLELAYLINFSIINVRCNQGSQAPYVKQANYSF